MLYVKEILNITKNSVVLIFRFLKIKLRYILSITKILSLLLTTEEFFPITQYFLIIFHARVLPILYCIKKI